MKQYRLCATLILGVALTGACGGGDGSASVDTGLSETRLLSDVSAEEAGDACEAIESTFNARLSPQKMVRALCETFGAFFTQNPGDCRTMADSCIEEAERGEGNFAIDDMGQDFDCDSGDVAEALADCDATVGELEGCFTDVLSTTEEALTRFTCADAGSLTEADQEAIASFGDTDPPASCQALNEQCPSLDL